MKYLILFWVYFGFLGLPAYAQEPARLNLTDTISFYQHQLIISYPKHFIRTQRNLDYGGKAYTYSATPPISFITVMESTNTMRVFGEKCLLVSKFETEDRVTEKGVCLLKGYYRVDYFKKSRISITYEVVSECDLPYYDSLLDTVKLHEVVDR